MNKKFAVVAVGFVLLLGLFAWKSAQDLHGVTTSVAAEIPVKDSVTLVDLGATSCVPCKMMAPILGEIEREYKGRAAVMFIDVWKNQGQAERFDIRTIPTQIFYDKSGKEAFRHVGFMDKASIKSVLDRLLSASPQPAGPERS